MPFAFTARYPLPDYGLIGVYQKFRRISVQLTSNCTNKCFFCPVPVSKRQHGTMSLKNYEYILNSIKDFDGRILLALNGESLLLENLDEYCRLTRYYWPKATIHLITTLNINRGKNWLANLCASGLDSLQISCYGYSRNEYKYVHGVDRFESVCANICHLASLKQPKDIRLLVFDEGDLSEKARLERVEFLRFVAANGVHTATVRRRHSWQGRVNIPQPTSSLINLPCSVVWGSRANHLNISWEGNIVPCCYFLGDEYVFGNIFTSPLLEIFQSEAYRHFYQSIWNHLVDTLPVCRSCSLFAEPGNTSIEEYSRLAAYSNQHFLGKYVYIWGGGEAMRLYRQFLSAIKPKAVLMDSANPPKEIEGIQVMHPDQCLKPKKASLPIVICAQPQNSAHILEKLKQRYPWYPINLVHIIPAALADRRWREIPTLTLAEEYTESVDV